MYFSSLLKNMYKVECKPHIDTSAMKQWDFPRKDHADPPPQNVTKLFTGLLQPTFKEGTGSFVSGGPYGPEGEPPLPPPLKCDKTLYSGV